MFAIYAPNPHDVHDVHSIYFEILGEHGFVGLALFLLLGAFTWLSATRKIRRRDEIPTCAGLARPHVDGAGQHLSATSSPARSSAWPTSTTTTRS